MSYGIGVAAADFHDGYRAVAILGPGFDCCNQRAAISGSRYSSMNHFIALQQFFQQVELFLGQCFIHLVDGITGMADDVIADAPPVRQ